MLRQRITIVPIGLVLVGVVYLVVTLLAQLLGHAIAHADTGAAVASDVPIGKYGWVGGVLALYVAARWFLRKNSEAHWIAQGRTLSIATAVLSVVGSIVGWKLGMDPDTIGFAIAGAVPLAIPSTVTSAAGGASSEQAR